MSNVNGVETGIIPIFFNHYCDSNNITYGGEFIEFSFPFLVEPSTLGIKSAFAAPESVLLGSADGGTTWDFICTIYITAPDPNIATMKLISTTSKYSRFKWIMIKSQTGFRTIVMNHLSIFGDIYA